ncbi:glycosyltransferase [Paenarthrobacter sp. NPDC092416]|uniref:glycosyltransferase n=1 Tax=Paenarthrobacter sp. NPDC092416 TaxID=3364386 RepID=UPI00380D4F2F
MARSVLQGPLTILIGADTYPPDINGAAMSTYRLAMGMKARGHKVHVIAARSEVGPSVSGVEDGVTVHRLRSHAAPTHPTLRLCLPWQIKGEVRKIFKDVSPDVAHIQCHYMVGESVAKEAVRSGTRLIATNHFMPENMNPFLPFPQWFLKIVAKNSWRDMDKVLGMADVITTPTTKSAETMYSHGFSRSVVPVSNGIDAERYELAPGELIDKPEAPVILFVGRLAKEKNVDQLIDAFALLPADLEARLEIVGVGEQRPALEMKAKHLQVAEKVTFTGFATDEELRCAYLRSSVFAMPGTADLQSLVSLEAMSASKPLVLANALALPHLVNEGINGFLFTPGDRREFSRQIERILRLSEQERHAMGTASRAMVAQHSFATSMTILESLYRSDRRDEEALPPSETTADVRK